MNLPIFRPLTPAPADTVSSHEATEAYARVRPDLDALPPEAVGRINARVTTVVAIALGAWPHINALLSVIAMLPQFDVADLRKLPDYVYALYYADVMATLSSEGAADVPAMVAEATPMRDRMLSVAEGMAKYDLVDPKQVANIRSGLGHLDTAHDLGALAALFRGLGPEQQSRLPVPEAEIDRAAELSLQLIAALGRRQVGSDGSSLPSRYEDDRTRAFRLVVRSYDQARRAVSFLRWSEGDADLLVPSFFSGKRRRGTPTPEPVEAPVEGEAPNKTPAADDDDNAGV